uniref:50S ribosomal protein L9, chloroplastic n=1 Tax=Leiomenia cribrosa TaxID=217483 RepID=A0A4D6WVG9_9FLOR|nr:ribosomal protein L9 [Leiomenia cribrosa]
MKRKTKVIIKQNINKLGKKGDIINVARGYAFNYLIPNHFAELATVGKLKHLKMFEKIKNIKLEAEKIEAKNMQKNLEKISKISIKKKVGDNQQIFGSVNEKEIIKQINNYTGYELEKKQINIPNIKSIGIYTIKIDLFNNIFTNLKLQVLPEEIEINM